MTMKRTSLSFLTIIILILSSSCASLNQNSAKKAVTTAVKAKINSRNYVIEMPKTLTTNYKRMIIPVYIHVSGDSLHSFTEKDNQDDKGDDPQIVVINQGNLIPIRYKLVFGRSNKVRIYRDSYAITGILKL